MHQLRKIVVALALVVLPIALFIFGFLWSTHYLFGSPERMKQTLADSGMYDTFVRDVLLAEQADLDTGQGEIPLDEPEVRQIVQNAASPALLQEQTERFIDDLHAWASGERPALIINLTDVKTKLVNDLTAYASNRLAALPACTAPPIGEFNPLTAECVPPGTDKRAAVDQIRNHIDAQLGDPIIRPDTTATSEVGSYQANWQNFPETYERIVRSLWISGILALIMAIAAIFLSPRISVGFRRVGVVFTVVGGLTVLIALVGGAAIRLLAKNAVKDGSPEGLARLATTVTDRVSTYWLWFGVAASVLGVLMIIAAIIMRKPTGGQISTVSGTEGDSPSSTEVTATDESSDKPVRSRSKSRHNK